jgi:hypothetical protein
VIDMIDAATNNLIMTQPQKQGKQDIKKAFKLLRLRKNGTIGPLFINRKQVIPVGQWLPAEDHPTNGFAHRPGWHVTPKPIAPHLSIKDRVWMEVEILGIIDEIHRPLNRVVRGGLPVG